MRDWSLDGSGVRNACIHARGYTSSLVTQTTDSRAFVQTVTPWTDVVLIGTGATMQPIPAHIVAFLRQHQLPFEIASTVSAVSTFNVLCQEGRPVMAAVLNLNNKDDESRTEKKSFAR